MPRCPLLLKRAGAAALGALAAPGGMPVDNLAVRCAEGD